MADVGAAKGGKRLPKGTRYAEGPTDHAYIRVRDFRDGSVDCGDLRFITPDVQAQVSRYTVSTRDVYVSIAGTIGLAGRIPAELEGANLTENAAKIVLRDGTDPDYLWRYLSSPGGRRQIEELTTSTSQPKLALFRIESIELPVAPINEQKRIVAKLEALQARSDAAKEALDAIPPLLEKFRQSVLAAAFRGDLTKQWREQHPDAEPASELLKRIRVERRRKWIEAAAEKGRARAEAKAKKAGKLWSDEDDTKVLEKERAKAAKKYKEPEPVDPTGLPELPEGWCWATLGELSWFVKDGPHHSPKYSEAGIPFISGRNVSPAGVDFATAKYISPELHAEYSKRCCPKPGDILYTKGGTTGIACVNEVEAEFNVWVHVAVIKLADSVSPHFVRDMLNSPRCYAQSQKLTHGVSNQDLGLTRIVTISMPLPPLAEQEEIVSEVSKLLLLQASVAEQESRFGALVGKLEQSILAKAFKGELVRQDPNDEPASVLLERIRAEREAAEPKKKKARRGGR